MSSIPHFPLSIFISGRASIPKLSGNRNLEMANPYYLQVRDNNQSMSNVVKNSPVKNATEVKSEKKWDNKIDSKMPVKNEEDKKEEENSILSDPEDYLEEDETLDMNLSTGQQKIWLVKLPRYLAEKWSNTNELSGKQLATVKIKKNTGGGKLKVKLVLDEKTQDNIADIPHEYDISMLNTQVRNSYVFSEENLHKFKQELTEVAQMPDQPELPNLDKKQMQIPVKKPFFRVQKNGDDNKKYIPYVKTIPKKTALLGKICHDCQIIPAKSDSKYGQILSNRQNISQGPARPKVTFLTEIPGVLQANAGPSLRGNNTSVFLKSNTNKKNIDGRAIRMPKKDLLDLLFRLFEEYEYWSMKGLKERTRQPESYLKESLESIANLIKKGPYTSKYNLKAEYRRLRDAERAVRLGLDGNEEKEADNDDDDDDEMEDVV